MGAVSVLDLRSHAPTYLTQPLYAGPHYGSVEESGVTGPVGNIPPTGSRPYSVVVQGLVVRAGSSLGRTKITARLLAPHRLSPFNPRAPHDPVNADCGARAADEVDTSLSACSERPNRS